ncbi:uncharacterized protein IWZ02DRAFT_293792 [Phyllosticta citriasiana]|uniref:uncharacterized protein n=1 Tax=Phyllosticta citriasiana TaxID=595635 RepID=UPI0030FD388D
MEHGMGRQSPSELGGDDYDMLSESVAISDDEADTISSSDFANVGPTGEDVCSVADTDTSTEDNLSGGEEEEEEEEEPVFQPSDSNATTRADIRTPNDSVLYGPAHPAVETQSDDTTEESLYLTLSDGYEHLARGRNGPFGLGSFAEIQLGAAPRSMTWTGPFRIRFTTFPSGAFFSSKVKDLIQRKIASALDAGRPDSDNVPKRLAVVRIPGSDVELVPSSEIYMVPEETDSSERPTPDLEVVLHYTSNQGNAACVNDCSTGQQSKVPVLHLAFDVSNNANFEHFQPAKGSLRLVVRNGQEVSTIPAPLDAFFDLHPVYLNRHLAFLGLGEEKARRRPTFQDQFQDIVDRVHIVRQQIDGAVRSFWANRRTHIATVVVIILSLFMLCATAMVNNSLVSSSLEVKNPSPTTSDATALSSAIDAFSGRSATPDWTTAVPSVRPEKDLIASKHAEKSSRMVPMVHPFSPKANESDEFKIHVIGDHHFVLTPPKVWSSLKRPPALLISISRGHQEIRHSHEQLVDGVYAVSVEGDEAYGLLNVSILTTSRPRIQQTLEVDFGSSWFKMSRWAGVTEKALGMMRSDMVIAQSNARNTSLQLFKGLEVFKNITRNVTEDAAKSLVVVTDRARQLLDKGVLRAHQQAGEVLEEERALVQHAAVAIAQVKESARENVKRARTNALGIYTKISLKFSWGDDAHFEEIRKKIKRDRLRAEEKARRAFRGKARRQARP